MGLAQKILAEKINERISFIDRQGYRKFDNKVDIVSFALTPRQFFALKKEYKLEETQVLCSGRKITPFIFNDYSIKVTYNDKMDHYEIVAKHHDYIEDFDAREDYLDTLA